MDILSNFAENFFELMFDKHLTPELLSTAVKIDRSLIYRYLRKEILPTLPNAIAIADYFQCSLDFLLGLSPDNPITTYQPAPPFSQRFKEILKEKNLTRYRLYHETNFAKQSIDDWFHGKRIPSLGNVVLLANYFHCSVDYLLGRE